MCPMDIKTKGGNKNCTLFLGPFSLGKEKHVNILKQIFEKNCLECQGVQLGLGGRLQADPQTLSPAPAGQYN